MEKLLFPAFLLLFEVIFLVVFGLLVEYDERGSPDHEIEEARLAAGQGDSDRFIRELESSLSITKSYPCKLQQANRACGWTCRTLQAYKLQNFS